MQGKTVTFSDKVINEGKRKQQSKSSRRCEFAEKHGVFEGTFEFYTCAHKIFKTRTHTTSLAILDTWQPKSTCE
jgi:hypothetical protein